MLVLLLFAFAPREAAPLPARPDLHLDAHPAQQWRLSARRAWADFQETWGGRWTVRWDERTGAPRFLGAPGVPAQAAAALVADVARLSGVDPAELSLSRRTALPSGDREILQWTRRVGRAPVVDDQVALVLTGGRIGAVWVSLTDTAGLPPARAGESILQRPSGRGALARETRTPTSVTWRGRDGQVILAYDPRRFADLTVTHEERTVGDPLVTDPARQVTVVDSAGTSEVSDDAGATSLSGDLTVQLTGPSLRITDNRSSIAVSGTDDLDLTGGDNVTAPAAMVLHHFHVVWDWLALRWPGHAWLSDQVLADVNQPGACNAYYSSGTVNFYPEAPGYCNNTGQIADVIYHEVGHGIHEYILAAGTFASDISEGSSDFVSATINDDPNTAAGFYSFTSAPLRELDTDRFYPTNVTGEPHNDGLIWGSFLWNLRDQWIAAYGEAAGVEATDLLFLGALAQGPTMTDLAEAVLVADDDDGDWSNGTPHDCELLTLLDYHGLGPGPLGVVELVHQPLEAQESATDGYPVTFDLYTPLQACTGADDPTVTLWYSTDADARAPLLDAALEGWLALPLSQTGDHFEAALPRRPANSAIRYFIEVTSADGEATEASHGGLDDGLYGFWVGDRATLWCDDFDTGDSVWSHGAGLPWVSPAPGGAVDEWAFGAPVPFTWGPDTAWSGSQIVATNLGDTYSNRNLQYLASPSVAFRDAGLMRLLSFRRWLTVEDGFYDQARLFLREGEIYTELWSNARTDGGVTHTLDADWTLQDYPLADFLAEDGSSEDVKSFVWSLQSDEGLAFGGWALDDVCVVELDDPPAHYRRAAISLEAPDLTGLAEGEPVGEVTVRWIAPWIVPLSRVTLVRKAGDWPTGPSDGVVLDEVVDPTPGEEFSFSETGGDLSVGELWYYAVFSEGREVGDPVPEVEEGQNGALLDLSPPPPEEVEDTATDDTAPPEDSDPPVVEDTGAVVGKPTGCGCASGGAPTRALAILPLLIGLLRRRSGAAGRG